jgi:hypothetical protein
MLKNLVLDLEPRMTFEHHPNLPPSFRMLIIGSSGSGKTCLLLRMLLEPGFLDYDDLIIYTPTKSQQEYQLLYHGFSEGLSKESIASILINQEQFKGVPIEALCKKLKEVEQRNADQNSKIITCLLTDKTNDLIPPHKLDKTKKHLIIFDDCISSDNQTKLSSYFIKGRHNSCNSIYLTQSYFDLDRMIRLNVNILILFKLNSRNKTDIFNSIASNILDRKEFDALASNIWSKKHKYLVINRHSEQIIDDIFEEDSDSDNDSIK